MIHLTPLLVITLGIVLALSVWLVFFALRPRADNAPQASRRAVPMMVIAGLLPAVMFGTIVACILVALAG